MRTHSLQVGAPGGVTVRLVGIPRLWREPAYLGHMANDPVGYAPTKEKYKELAEATGNAAFVGLACGLCVAVVATRSIQAGEEVLPHKTRCISAFFVLLVAVSCSRTQT